MNHWLIGLTTALAPLVARGAIGRLIWLAGLHRVCATPTRPSGRPSCAPTPRWGIDTAMDPPMIDSAPWIVRGLRHMAATTDRDDVGEHLPLGPDPTTD